MLLASGSPDLTEPLLPQWERPSVTHWDICWRPHQGFPQTAAAALHWASCPSPASSNLRSNQSDAVPPNPAPPRECGPDPSLPGQPPADGDLVSHLPPQPWVSPTPGTEDGLPRRSWNRRVTEVTDVGMSDKCSRTQRAARGVCVYSPVSP